MEFNRFDVSTKELVWDDPAAWLERFGIGPPGPVEVIDSDITALTASADKVIRVGGSEPYLVNLELQSSHAADLVETLWFRQAALFRRQRLPVLTVLVLLRREANSPRLSGAFEIRMPDGWQTNRYNYRVVRLWGEDPEPYLTAGVNLVPLAPLTNVRAERMNCPPWCGGWMVGSAPSRGRGPTNSGRRRICSWGCVIRTSWHRSYWKECRICRNRRLIRRS